MSTDGRDPASARAGLKVGCFLGAVLIGGWVTAAVLMSTRGLDLVDESYYLLSYRWWDVNLLTFTGVQYLYGPVFQALGWSIPLLRLARLASIVLAHAYFALTYMRWLRGRRPAAPQTRLWELSGTLLIVASGSVCYSWLPQSPGYNDVSLIGALVATGTIFAAARRADAHAAGSWLPPVVAGVAVAAVVLSKWSSGVVLVTFVGIGAVLIVRRPWRSRVRGAVGFASGLVLALLMVHVFVAPLDTVVPPMLEVNHRAASSTNAPASLLLMYVRTTADLLKIAAWIALLPTVTVFWMVRRGARPPRAGTAAAALALPLSIAVTYAILGRWPVGGGSVTWLYATVLVGIGLVAVCVSAVQWFSSPAPRWRGDVSARAAVGLLVLMPAVQAVGTGNALYILAVNGYAFWVAAAVGAATNTDQHPAVRTGLVSAVVTAACMCTVVGTTGVLLYPYGTGGFTSSTVAAQGAALRGLRLPPAEARFLTDTDRLTRGQQRGMAFDELPGALLAAGLAPVGEAWFSSKDVPRSLAGVRTACSDAPGPPPVVIATRTLDPVEREVLRECGWDVYRDYRAHRVVDDPWSIRVYVPGPP